MDWVHVDTARGASVRVLQGGAGDPLVFIHGGGGISPDPMLEHLSEHYAVSAPELPGFGESTGEDTLWEMLDFTLHSWDVVDALGIDRCVLIGQSAGGMIAAEMAALCPERVTKLVLLAPAGIWLDEHPLPDFFAILPHEMPAYAFHDPAKVAAASAGAPEVSDEARVAMQIDRSRSMGNLSKILFPIPDRGLAARLYRVRADTLLIWGESDRLIPPVYADRWRELIPQASVVTVAEAGHAAQFEQPEHYVAAVEAFLTG
jgi:pimeloyl-ACP methyl ester carboxylesterase